MCILVIMNLKELLNAKFLEWQYKSGERKTITEFAEYIGVKQNLLTMWMNGQRNPGTEYKRRLIQLFGDDALETFGEDPDLFVIKENWEYINPETKKHLRAEVEQAASDRLRELQKQRRTKQAS